MVTLHSRFPSADGQDGSQQVEVDQMALDSLLGLCTSLLVVRMEIRACERFNALGDGFRNFSPHLESLGRWQT